MGKTWLALSVVVMLSSGTAVTAWKLAPAPLPEPEVETVANPLCAPASSSHSRRGFYSPAALRRCRPFHAKFCAQRCGRPIDRKKLIEESVEDEEHDLALILEPQLHTV